MRHFRPIDRRTECLLPPSVQEWLPESHLARYVLDVLEAGPVGAGACVGRVWQRCLPPGDAAVAADRRLCEGDAFKSPDRAGDLRLAGVTVHRLQSADHDALATFRRRFGEQFADIFEARAKERFEREQAEYAAKMAERQARQASTGKKRGGKPPRATTRSGLVPPLRRVRAARGACLPRPTDEARPQDSGWPRRLRAQEADGGAGVRHHQVGDGLPSVSTRGLDNVRNERTPGVPGVELQAHGRIASAVRKKDKNMAISREDCSFCAEVPFISHIMERSLPLRRSPASSPTGCWASRSFCRGLAQFAFVCPREVRLRLVGARLIF